MGQSGCIRSRKHQVALQTASVQNLQTFSKNIAISVTLNPQNLVPGDCDVNQVIPIIQFLCDKLEDGLVTAQVFPVEFSLESIQALLSNLPDGVVLNSRSHSFVWRTLCPTLLKLVGVPCPNAPATTDGKISELRCVASIGCELLRLFGNVNVLRAPLESLFHRLLVTDHIATRIEMFKTIKEVSVRLSQNKASALMYCGIRSFPSLIDCWSSADLSSWKEAIKNLSPSQMNLGFSECMIALFHLVDD